MLTTTLNRIAAYIPCQQGWSTLIQSLCRGYNEHDPISIETIIHTNGVIDAVWALRACVDGHVVAAQLITKCSAFLATINSDCSFQRSTIANFKYSAMRAITANGSLSAIHLYTWLAADSMRAAGYAAQLEVELLTLIK